MLMCARKTPRGGRTGAWYPPAAGGREKAAHPTWLASWQIPCGPLSRDGLAITLGNPCGLLPTHRLPTWLRAASCSRWVWISLASRSFHQAEETEE